MKVKGDLYGDFPEYRRKEGWPRAHVRAATSERSRHSPKTRFGTAALAFAGAAGLLLTLWLIYRAYAELALKSPTAGIETPAANPTAPR